MNLYQFFTPKARTFYLPSDATVAQALDKFDFHKFVAVPIVGEKGEYLSTVSEGDILRFLKNVANFDARAIGQTLVTQIEKYRPYRALDLSAPTESILQLSLEQNFIPLVDDRGAYLGILKRKEIIQYLYSIHSNYFYPLSKED